LTGWAAGHDGPLRSCRIPNCQRQSSHDGMNDVHAPPPGQRRAFRPTQLRPGVTSYNSLLSATSTWLERPPQTCEFSLEQGLSLSSHPVGSKCRWCDRDSNANDFQSLDFQPRAREQLRHCCACRNGQRASRYCCCVRCHGPRLWRMLLNRRLAEKSMLQLVLYALPRSFLTRVRPFRPELIVTQNHCAFNAQTPDSPKLSACSCRPARSNSDELVDY
jgi:hypothetical protein